MSKRSSTIRKENYEKLLLQFKEMDMAFQLSNVRVYKGVQHFCVYLANYTSITDVDQIDRDCVEQFLKYLVENQKRLHVTLTDIKKTIVFIQEVTKISSGDHLFDFSLSNVSLWSNLK
ncbi:swarming motility protein SwrAA [Bacillus kexueae]|uniref:swarming motility protein SwrAA n=1 Tax=Aeribacillus kexueae TaxID=2078952 RepID=UPI001FB0151B|nr:swarming motility protein SwrAA [Bacillus kexueae]